MSVSFLYISQLIITPNIRYLLANKTILALVYVQHLLFLPPTNASLPNKDTHLFQ